MAAMVYGVHEYDWNPPHQADGGMHNGGPASPATQPDQSGVVSVMMTDQAVFVPASLTVPAGTKVRWKNASREDHTVTDDPKVASDAKDVTMPAGATAFNSGTIKPGAQYEVTFTVPGSYKYVCEPHEGMDMKGTIEVTPAAGTKPQG